jgi:parallel beta-helix repeat protein
MKHLFSVILIFIISQKPIYAKEYFVDSISGKDSNSGTTSNSPWQTLTRVQNASFMPGDIISFARGASWTTSKYDYLFLINNSGTAENPITYRAYGTGQLPSFSNTGSKYNQGIKIQADYIIIENLKVTQGYEGFLVAEGSENNIIRDCEVSGCGDAFYIYGSNNLFTRNYIHDLIMVVDNVIPDNQSGGGDYGCVSFWLFAPDNEISYNRCINNIGHSYDYQYDGGFLEFYENCDNTYAHHNWVENGMGLMEASNGHSDNVTMSYNVFIENKSFFAPHYTQNNFKFENNTCITRKGTLWGDMFLGGTNMIIRNNIFVYVDNGDYSPGEITKKASSSFTHENNLYYLPEGASLGGLVLGTGEKIGNPMFMDEANKDFRLKANSPAINVGADLGYHTDFNDKNVPFSSSPDLGAYEAEYNEPEMNIKQGISGIQDNDGVFNFGDIAFDAPQTKIFTIENSGTNVLDLTGETIRVVVQGEGFSLVTDAESTVGSGGSTTFSIAFAPSVFGSYAGIVSIANNDSDENPYNFSLKGDGYDPSKTTQTITFDELSEKTIGDDNFELTATASSGSSLNYTSSNADVVTISGSTVHIVGVGATVITATQVGDSNTNPAKEVKRTLTVVSERSLNLISNPAFVVNTDGWSVYNKEGALSSISTVDKDGYSGMLGKVDVSDMGDPEGVYNIQVGINYNVEEGRTYSVKFKASAENNRSISLFSLLNASPWSTLFSKNDINITTTPTNYGPYNSDCNYTGSVVFRFLLGASNETFYFDDMEIRDITQITAIDNISQIENLNLVVYPNPVANLLHVNLLGFSGETTVSVIDLQGRLILAKKMYCNLGSQQTYTMDVSSLSSGVHFVRAFDSKNVLQVKKIVVVCKINN